MKQSKEYSKKIQGLYRLLKRKYPKVKPFEHEKIENAVVFGIICEKISEKETTSIISKLDDYFVDLNDLRVSRPEEIAELMGEVSPFTKNIALRVTQVLQGIFNTYHKINLEALRKIGKRPARQALEKLEGTSRFVIDYCMLTSLKGHAIPLTANMIEYLKNNELVESGADEQAISGFLAKQISAKNGYEFYSLLRRESESSATRKKSRTKTTRKKKAARTKTKAKKKKAKKTTKKTTKKKTKKKVKKTTRKKKA